MRLFYAIVYPNCSIILAHHMRMIACQMSSCWESVDGESVSHSTALSMCIGHSNPCNVIVGVFICSNLFHSVRLTAASFSFIYLLVMTSLAEHLTIHRGAPVGKTLKIKDLIFLHLCLFSVKYPNQLLI